ncbi:MAG: ornithine cyclodeaminase, partial [Pseudomonadota bacterium]
KWKTAGDSLLAALRLAPQGAQTILVVGAGTVAASVIEAFGAGFPGASFTVWNRTEASGRALCERTGAAWRDDLAAAVEEADIIVGCTMATEPWLNGEWLRPGQHVNLIGAYRPDMREVDDAALARARVYVDSYDTTLDHIGELKIPLATGAIAREAVLADYYALGDFARTDGDITIFKNGGGAHLDLMTATYIQSVLSGT